MLHASRHTKTSHASSWKDSSREPMPPISARFPARTDFIDTRYLRGHMVEPSELPRGGCPLFLKPVLACPSRGFPVSVRKLDHARVRLGEFYGTQAKMGLQHVHPPLLAACTVVAFRFRKQASKQATNQRAAQQGKVAGHPAPQTTSGNSKLLRATSGLRSTGLLRVEPPPRFRESNARQVRKRENPDFFYWQSAAESRGRINPPRRPIKLISLHGQD